MGVNFGTFELQRGAEPLLRDLIHERAGLHYPDNKIDILREKIAPLVIDRGFDSFLDYYYLLKFDAQADDEWEKVKNALSVQETYFWREMDQIEELARAVMPILEEHRNGFPIRIWSAACATGEEPLTIAMRLNEDRWFERTQIEIYASDLSHEALEKARRGSYRERSFRALPAHLRSKYFTEDGDQWRIDPSIHSKVRWQQVNLLDRAQTAHLATSSVVFCRNVFIYFSADAIRRVVDSFSERMAVPAFLFCGASESLLKVTDDFELEEIGSCFAYVKRN